MTAHKSIGPDLAGLCTSRHILIPCENTAIRLRDASSKKNAATGRVREPSEQM